MSNREEVLSSPKEIINGTEYYSYVYPTARGYRRICFETANFNSLSPEQQEQIFDREMQNSAWRLSREAEIEE
jgi:hypothetical protein